MHRLFYLGRGSRSMERGWGAVAGSVLGSLIGKHGAQQSAQTAAQSQQDIAQQQAQQAQAYQAQQEAQLRTAIQQMLGQTNPFQQAAQNMKPFFGAPGGDTAMFGPQSPTGQQTSGNATTPQFAAPVPVPQAPPPQQSAPPPPQNRGEGWGPRYGPRMGKEVL